MPRYLAAGFFCLLSLLFYLPDAAAQIPKPQRPFSAVVEQWNRAFDAIAQEIDRGEISPARANTLKGSLADIDTEAEEIRQNARSALDPLRVQLEALGPAPAEDTQPEAPEITAQRTKIVEDIADYEARIKQADLTSTRVKDLTVQINELALSRSIRLLIKAFPLPVAPSTIAEAVPEFFRLLATMTTAPAEWWQALTEDDQQRFVSRIALFLLPALILAWLLRRALLRFFGRDPEIQHPTYMRRLTGAIAEGLAHGIVPSFILAVIIWRVNADTSLISGLFAQMAIAACAVAIMVILAWALPRAVLAPDLPAWRLIPFSARHARIISRRITYLAAVFAVDIFLVVTTRQMDLTDQLNSLYTLVASAFEVAGILLLTQGRLWAWEPDDSRTTDTIAAEVGEPERARRWRFWPALRRVIGLLALAAVASAVVGYANLSRYVIENLVISGMAIGILFLVRGLIRELIGAALRSRVLQAQLAIPHKTRQRYKFWLRALLDISIKLGGAVVLLIVWGVPGEDIYAWSRGVLQEFTIGNVTISLTDIVVAVFVFVAAMTATRAAQRALTDHVFPQTNLDVGVQNSLSSGFGYVGLAVAVMLAISAIGLDLSNIALIAGALSVGIGFGLQAIINNFVSGLILLIERPIKVGDWIVAGGHEGTVKRINVRATEIETFQRASIIVPNSELITGAVTNWTHKDRYGRVEIPIGVAYGSDVEQAIAVLKKCLQDHEQILPWPEPYVLFRRFGESSLDLEARGYIGNVTARITVVSDLCLAIERAFRDANIEIPFPQRDLHIRSASGLDQAQRQRMAAAGTEPSAQPQGNTDTTPDPAT